MIKKITFILVILIVSSGCTQSKEYSIYNPDNLYRVGNKQPIKIPSDIKLRKAQSAEYYVKESNTLPKPVPSMLPPDSEALRVYNENEDRLDMPYYERFPTYPMPKTVSEDRLDVPYYERVSTYPMPK